MFENLNEILHPQIRTGKRGRPSGSGKPWVSEVYNICALLAADGEMSVADAVRRVIDDPKDTNAVDRLTGKVRQNPSMLERAKVRREKGVQRVLQWMRVAPAYMTSAVPFTRAEFNILLRYRIPLGGEFMDDPRVQRAAEELWTKVRPSKMLVAIWCRDEQGDLETLLL